MNHNKLGRRLILMTLIATYFMMLIPRFNSSDSFSEG